MSEFNQSTNPHKSTSDTAEGFLWGLLLASALNGKISLNFDEEKNCTLVVKGKDGEEHPIEIEINKKDEEKIQKMMEEGATVNFLNYANPSDLQEAIKNLLETDSLECNPQKKNPLPCVDDKPI